MSHGHICERVIQNGPEMTQREPTKDRWYMCILSKIETLKLPLDFQDFWFFGFSTKRKREREKRVERERDCVWERNKVFHSHKFFILLWDFFSFNRESRDHSREREIFYSNWEIVYSRDERIRTFEIVMMDRFAFSALVKNSTNKRNKQKEINKEKEIDRLIEGGKVVGSRSSCGCTEWRRLRWKERKALFIV